MGRLRLVRGQGVSDASGADNEGIWRQLQRRKVIQWGLAYVAFAWGFLQGLEYVGEAFGWPGHIRQIAIFVVMAGLPVVILVAWYHGDRGRQRVTPTELTMVALLIVAGGLFVVAATSAWLLSRRESSAQALLADARFSTLTDFDGIEQDAAISRDGKFAAFLSNHEGPFEAWVTQIGSGEFHNLTRGRLPDVLNDAVRTVGFTPDGSNVTLWGRTPGLAAGERRIATWSVPTMGGALRQLHPGVTELAWSSDATRLVYHTPAPGDPMFVTEAGGQDGRQIHVAPRGTHCHFPVWSPDDDYIYFVRGKPPDVMDIWRVRPDGSGAERITFHASRVTYPVFVDRRRLLYLATIADGSGPWLHVLDVRRRESRRLVIGTDRYESLAASADGRRLLATVVRPRSTLWQLPIRDSVAEASAVTSLELPTTGGRSPRIGPGYLLYIASKREQQGIWKLIGKEAIELWSRPQTRLVGVPAISPDGRQIAFTAERDDESRLHLMDADGGSARVLAPSLEVLGSPSWAPDGQTIAVAALRGAEPVIFEVPLDGRAPAPLVDHYSTDPHWSPAGDFLAYAGPQVGVSLDVRAVTRGGAPHELPKMTLMRGAEHISFLRGRRAAIVLRGERGDRDFFLVDLDSGHERRLTRFGREIAVGDFDVSPDGSEIILDRRADAADILLIERDVD